MGQVKTGGVVSTTVTVWLQVAMLVHTSWICQVRVMTIGQIPLVTVSSTVRVTLVPLHAPKAVGESKLQVVPQLTVLLVGQLGTGGEVPQMPLPEIAKSKGFAVLSLLAMLSVAVRKPGPLGSKVTVKSHQAPPPAMTTGTVMTGPANSDALLPVKVMPVTVNGALPKFLTVKVCVIEAAPQIATLKKAV